MSITMMGTSKAQPSRGEELSLMTESLGFGPRFVFGRSDGDGPVSKPSKSSLSYRGLATPAGLEPATPGLGNRCSIR